MQKTNDHEVSSPDAYISNITLRCLVLMYACTTILLHLRLREHFKKQKDLKRHRVRKSLVRVRFLEVT